MIQLLYTDTDSFSEQDFHQLLQDLPSEDQEQILRFKFLKDRLLKLMAKILVQRYFSLNSNFDWKDLKYSKEGKPFIDNKDCFNISHSGSIAIVAFSEHMIGIDIEQKIQCDPKEIVKNFHAQEIEYLESTGYDTDEFYRVWTRKEAYLKAKGVGIVSGLEHYSCLQSTIVDGHEWHLKTLELEKGYATALCQNAPINRIEINKIVKHELLNIYQ